MNPKNKQPRVIILESDRSVSENARSILEKEGWDVTCKTVSKEALETLSQSGKKLFTLFISNFRLPKMEGDDVLSKVKSISPLTQRMLIVPDEEQETLIKAINKAEIHASVISPYKDENLADQAKKCLDRFRHAVKQARLKRVTSHQNKQMKNIARKLKKKSEAYKDLIGKKNTRLTKLESEKRKLESKSRPEGGITLEKVLDNKGIAPSPENYQAAFNQMVEGINLYFDRIVEEHDLSPFKTEDPFKEDLKDIDPSTEELAGDILNSVFARAAKLQHDTPASEETESGQDGEDRPLTLEDYFKISISEDMTSAWAEKIKEPDEDIPPHALEDMLDLLMKKEVSYGILPDEDIQNWLDDPSAEKILIAQGEAPEPGKNGTVTYHFQTDYSNPGKINEDGSIDFRERGDIPYVKTGDLLAEKTRPEEGKAGISISGVPIAIEEVMDPVFEAGTGTTLSEEENRQSIHAEIDGQPNCDALGNITVSPELVIPGDVDFETGNIDFKGNIIIKGMIKEGFTVRGIDVTVQEIEGGNIDISGDLNVSAGITESTVRVHGNTKAKFINHSSVMGFGDLIVSKEIIDSDIIISGCCINAGGHIISSRISAKLGIEGGSIGTDASTPVKLKVGVDKHIQILRSEMDEKIEACKTKAVVLKDEIQKLEDEDQTLYELISEKAQIQDRAQVEIREIKKIFGEIEKSNDQTRLKKAQNQIKELKEKAAEAEKELNRIFKTQDAIAGRIEILKMKIGKLEEETKTQVLQKKALKEFSKKEKPVAFVSVAKTITQGSSIKGQEASIYISEEKSHCKIQEIASEDSGGVVREMQITDL